MSSLDKISIVTSLYNSEPHIDEFYKRHLKVLTTLGAAYEFVFVNDGSPDRSRERVLELMRDNPRIKLVDLSRNFGQHAAMFSGMAAAGGNYICALDCDLEEEPENLLAMYDLIKKDPSIDVVYGVLNSRTGGFARKVIGGFFYKIFDLLTDVKIPHDQAWQRVMTKQYVEALLRYTESRTMPAGLMILAGFNQVPYLMDKKYKGSTTYTFLKRLRLALNSLTAFSARPLVAICLFGFLITIVSTIAISVIISLKLMHNEFQVGWISVISSVWLVGGLLMASVGIVGIYIARIFDQVKARPLYIVKEIHQS